MLWGRHHRLPPGLAVNPQPRKPGSIRVRMMIDVGGNLFLLVYKYQFEGTV
jgi:hypothetical protein